MHLCMCNRATASEGAHTFGTRIGALHAPAGAPTSSADPLLELSVLDHPAPAEGVADRAGVGPNRPTGSTLMTSEQTAAMAPRLTNAQAAQDLQCRFTAAATCVRMRLPTHHPVGAPSSATEFELLEARQHHGGHAQRQRPARQECRCIPSETGVAITGQTMTPLPDVDTAFSEGSESRFVTA